MKISEIIKQVYAFFKKIYTVWFPWLDIVILTLIYLFLWGEHINPYREYQLIKHGQVSIGKISGEAGLYQYSERPRMRDFEYTFTLPDGKTIKSSTHTFTLDKKNWKKPIYPITAEISYLPHQPEINWIKSDLSDGIGEFLYRHLIFGTLFISTIYMISMVVFRLNILEYREEKRTRKLAKDKLIMFQLTKEQMN